MHCRKQCIHAHNPCDIIAFCVGCHCLRKWSNNLSLRDVWGYSSWSFSHFTTRRVEYNQGTVWEAASDYLNMHFANLMIESDSFWTKVKAGFVFCSICYREGESLSYFFGEMWGGCLLGWIWYKRMCDHICFTVANPTLIGLWKLFMQWCKVEYISYMHQSWKCYQRYEIQFLNLFYRIC